MALKIGGTTVITNDLRLENITSLDATTIATLSANISGGSSSGSSLPITSLTGAVTLPAGTTLERPQGDAGMVRYNTELHAVEFWNTNTLEWQALPTNSPFLNPTLTTGQTTYTAAGTYSWVCPADVFYVCVVAVGGGGYGYTTTSGGTGGGGGGLGWENNIPVTPGTSYEVIVGSAGQDSSFKYLKSTTTYVYNTFTGELTPTTTLTPTIAVAGYGGSAGGTTIGGSGGACFPTTQGGFGGKGGDKSSASGGGGGGGAGGYTGNGGDGSNTYNTAGSAGSGGGGGGGASYVAGGGGGGVGLLGEGASGSGGVISSYQQAQWGGGYITVYAASGGGGGSGGAAGAFMGGYYGGGGAGSDSTSTSNNPGASGAVRIIWGPGRAFPSTNTGDL